MIDFATAAAENRRRSRLLVAALVAVAALAGFATDLALGSFEATRLPVVTVLAVGGASAMAWIAAWAGDRVVLATLAARPLSETDEEERQLANVVREMSVASGLPPPRVWVIDDDAPNALATGRDPEHASIAVTRGLLARLDRAQTQGVVAHEMSHIGNRDTRLGVLVAVLLGAIALLADAAWRVRRSGSGFGSAPRRAGTSGTSVGAGGGAGDGRGRAAIGLLVPLLLAAAALAPAVSRAIAFAISRQREYLADASAVSFTRNPLALAGALERIAADPRPTRAGMQGTAHLFFACPHASWADERRGRVADLFATHPPIAERIARLRAMAGGVASTTTAARAPAPPNASTPAAAGVPS